MRAILGSIFGGILCNHSQAVVVIISTMPRKKSTVGELESSASGFPQGARTPAIRLIVFRTSE